MKTKELTCVVCPMGCQITVSLDEDGTVLSVEGNTCKRGDAYARNELTDPRRTLTSTVVILGGTDKLLPVKTDAPIPRKDLLRAREALRELTVNAPVRCGDVLCTDFLGLGVSIVSGKTVEAC